MSRDVSNAPARRFVPHRATLPLTTLLFLAPWIASFAFGSSQAPALHAVEVELAAPEVLGERADRGQPVVWPVAVMTMQGETAEPRPQHERMLRLLGVVASAGSSSAVVGTPPDPLPHGAQPTTAVADHVAIGQAALARVAFPWDEYLDGWKVRFEPANGNLYGLTQPDRRRIEIYTHDTDVYEVARVVAHELGHALDLELLDTGMRRAWKSQRGMAADAAWWPTPGLADFDTGAGDFAECFATLSVGSVSLSPHGACSSADLDLLQSLIDA